LLRKASGEDAIRSVATGLRSQAGHLGSGGGARAKHPDCLYFKVINLLHIITIYN
jgi:hypothetical protein